MSMLSILPGRLDEDFVPKEPSYRKLTDELFAPAYSARIEGMGPLAQKRTFYRWLESQGLKVSEVPQYVVRAKADSHPATAGRDPAAYRKGDEIFIATGYNGRHLTDAEKLALAAHEFGHGASQSEEGAQEAAKSVMSAFGYTRPLEVLDLFSRNLRKAGMYSLN